MLLTEHAWKLFCACSNVSLLLGCNRGGRCFSALSVKLTEVKMEEELKCPLCRRLFTNPILLPCSHSLCLACAVSLQQPAQHFQNSSNEHGNNSGDDGNSSHNGSHLSEDQESDKVSLLSETDSGVVCNSRPNSYVGTPSIGNLVFSIQGNVVVGICCPVCKRLIFLDEDGANTLPKNRVLENIVDKYGENKNYVIQCQLCEGEKTNSATKLCEQCEVFYCDSCLESCHPSRGPLAKHHLVAPSEGKAILRTKHKNTQSKCSEHTDESLSMYCLMCKTIVCYVCVQDGRHINHDVQALGATCKAQKVSLPCQSDPSLECMYHSLEVRISLSSTWLAHIFVAHLNLIPTGERQNLIIKITMKM